MRGRSNVGKYYENFYEVFEQAVLNAVKPDMILTLTGGWDTRVIAGILSKNNVTLPAITWGSKLEKIIASKVASTLNFKHYSCLSVEQLRQKGYRYLLIGAGFDEVNGSWMGSKAKTDEQFEQVRKIYMLDFHTNLRKLASILDGFTVVTPILNPQVLACLNKIPWQLRKGKQMQRWILKNKFPKLWHIPYYNSLLPGSFPFFIHTICSMFHIQHLRRFFLIRIAHYPRWSFQVK
jgi:hypothetical protein